MPDIYRIHHKDVVKSNWHNESPGKTTSPPLLQNYNTVNRQSGCFEYLNINDSIIKKYGSYDIIVYRNGQSDTTFVIDYECNE